MSEVERGLFYILYGVNDFSLTEALAKIREELRAGELAEANTALLQGQEVSLGELIVTCNTMPFLSPKRLVVVEGLLGRFGRSGRQRPAPDIGEWRQLKGELLAMPPTTVLVLVEGELSRENPLFRELAPLAITREFPPLKGRELLEWIRARVHGSGSRISPGAVRLLAELVGGNLWVLASEIDKLCLYTGDRGIEEGDVRALVSSAREANIFAMVDAILDRHSAVATRVLQQLLNEGAAPPYLLFMITRQFRLAMRARELLGQHLDTAEVARRLGLTSEFVVRKALEQARRHSFERLRAIYHRLLDTDISIKTGQLPAETALDLLVSELCQGG